MTPGAIFWLTLGPALLAVVLGLLADAFAARGSAVPAGAVALLLAGGASAALVGGSTVATADAVTGFRVGGGASTVAGVCLAVSAMALASALSAPGRGRGMAPLVAIAATGGVLAATADDLLLALLALETVSVCSYALVASARTRAAAESAMKYFVQGAVATGFFVAGLVILAVITGGELRYAALSSSAELLGSALPVTLGLVLVTAAIAFKLGAVPFHAWVPDAYSSAHPSGAAVLAGPVKLAAGSVLAVIVTRAVPVASDVFARESSLGDLLPIFAVLSVGSMVVGSLGALGQRSYGRMLAYAGIAQVGYALVAVASLNSAASILHLALYAVGAAGAFIAASAFRAAEPGWDGSIDALAGMGRRRPVLAVSVTLCMVSLAGIPALGGFWGKFQAFGAGVAAASALWGNGAAWQGLMYILLVATGVVSSIVSVAYYGRVVRVMYGRPSGVPESHGADGETGSEPARMSVAGAVVAVAAVLLILAGGTPFLIGLSTAITPFVY